MSDGEAPKILTPIFEYLAQEPERHRVFARATWLASFEWDFHPCELECDAALEKLGLAKPGPGPDPDTLYQWPDGTWRD